MKAKKGISLIVLVITILVIIVLAGAVILTISNNNPLDNAKKANILSDRNSISNAVVLFISAKTTTENAGNLEDEVLKQLTNVSDAAAWKESGAYEPITNWTALDMKEPKVTNGTWKMNAGGKVILSYTAANAPTWIYVDNDKTKGFVYDYVIAE